MFSSITSYHIFLDLPTHSESVVRLFSPNEKEEKCSYVIYNHLTLGFAAWSIRVSPGYLNANPICEVPLSLYAYMHLKFCIAHHLQLHCQM